MPRRSGSILDMLGNIIQGLGAPTANDHAATKKYVDDQVALASGGAVTPTGAIWMWGTATPPTGWLLLNGQSTTGYPALAAMYGANLPDMRDMFPVGSSATVALLATGGQAKLSKHFHAAINGADWQDGTLNNSSDGAHLHTYDVGGATPGTANAVIQRSSGTVQATIGAAMGTNTNHTHTVSGRTASTGTGAGADENRPPFRALNFIVKI